jgi:hypothetical protein
MMVATIFKVKQNMISIFPKSGKVGINISVSHNNFTIRKQDITESRYKKQIPLNW